MLYVKIEDDQVIQILNEATLRKALTNVSLPKYIKDEHINASGFFCLAPSPVPEGIYESFDKRFAFNAIKDGDTWKRHVYLENVPEEFRLHRYNHKASRVRAHRDLLLNKSDWTQIPDVALTETSKAGWYEYRRALRDISLQANFPYLVSWPKIPK